SGVQEGPRCCDDDSDFRIIQVIGQGVKLAACRGLAVHCLPEKDLIHGNMVACHKLQKDLDAWVLPFVLYVRQVSGREEHLNFRLVSGFLSPRSCFFYCRSIRAEVDFLYWSL